ASSAAALETGGSADCRKSAGDNDEDDEDDGDGIAGRAGVDGDGIDGDRDGDGDGREIEIEGGVNKLLGFLENNDIFNLSNDIGELEVEVEGGQRDFSRLLENQDFNRQLDEFCLPTGDELLAKLNRDEFEIEREITLENGTTLALELEAEEGEIELSLEAENEKGGGNNPPDPLNPFPGAEQILQLFSDNQQLIAQLTDTLEQLIPELPGGAQNPLAQELQNTIAELTSNNQDLLDLLPGISGSGSGKIYDSPLLNQKLTREELSSIVAQVSFNIPEIIAATEGNPLSLEQAVAAARDSEIIAATEGSDVLFGGEASDVLFANELSDSSPTSLPPGTTSEDLEEIKEIRDLYSPGSPSSSPFGEVFRGTIEDKRVQEVIERYRTSGPFTEPPPFSREGRKEGFASNLDDTLTGTDLRNLIYGFGGNDVIEGLQGDDYLFGGDGGDRIEGGEGNDYILGNDGPDKLYGDTGDDIIWGGEGNDNLFSGEGVDYLNGGEGNDKLFALGAPDIDKLQRQVLVGGPGADVFRLRRNTRLGDDRLFTDRKQYAVIQDFSPTTEGDILELPGTAEDYQFKQFGPQGTYTAVLYTRALGIDASVGFSPTIPVINIGGTVGFSERFVLAQRAELVAVLQLDNRQASDVTGDYVTYF
ncbi:MAG: calcium-binding protein, partial [Prochloraceae cyanobacterium]